MIQPHRHKERSRRNVTPDRESLPREEQLSERCFIQPHTDASGDAYYIGDAYESALCAHEWEIRDGVARPYLSYVKKVATYMPHLEYLAHWMEVTCAPPKWKFIKECQSNRRNRARQCHVCVLNYVDGHPVDQSIHRDTRSLEQSLKRVLGAGVPALPRGTATPSPLRPHPTNKTAENSVQDAVIGASSEDGSSRSSFRSSTEATTSCSRASAATSKHQPSIRLVIAEDLSRDVVELLGSTYDVDPLFFLSHIGDYMFYNTRDRWVELPDLDFMTRQRTHYSVRYLRARYYQNQQDFDLAERESGGFNILRRLDSDRSRQRLMNGRLDKLGASVTLTRTKTSVWIKPRKSKDEDIYAIVLLDPTVSTGVPLWHGYRPFVDAPSMQDLRTLATLDNTILDNRPRKTLFDDVIHWTSNITDRDLAAIRADPKSVGVPILRLVLGDWRCVLNYMSTIIGNTEWEFERPQWGERPSDIDQSLRKLSPWRRNMPYYKAMISEAIDRLFPGLRRTASSTEPEKPVPESWLMSLHHDFELVQQMMDDSLRRVENIQTTASNAIDIEESRRTVEQGFYSRVTLLASLFIPLSFTTSFLSMAQDFQPSKRTIELFLVIGLPLTAFALIVMDLSFGEKSRLLKAFSSVSKALSTDEREQEAPQQTQVRRAPTMTFA